MFALATCDLFETDTGPLTSMSWKTVTLVVTDDLLIVVLLSVNDLVKRCIVAGQLQETNVCSDFCRIVFASNWFRGASEVL